MPPPLIVQGHDKGRLWEVPANPYCPANFEREMFLLQPFKRSNLQIWCPVTGGAYHSARKVTMCVRNNYKNWCSPELYPQDAPRVPRRPFLPYLFPRRGKDRAAGGTSETASTERVSAVREVSYPLSPFPPFQNTNASLVRVLGFSAAQAYLKSSKKEVW